MRKIIFAAALAFAGTAFSGATQAADPYKWCAQYGTRGDNGTNCYFVTFQQCQAAISGNGGFCRQNPFFSGRQAIREDRRRSF